MTCSHACTTAGCRCSATASVAYRGRVRPDRRGVDRGRRAADGRQLRPRAWHSRCDPTTGDDTIVIEAAFGLGEVVVGGEVDPDRYVVDAKTLAISSVEVGTKGVAVRRAADGAERRTVLDESEANRRVLTDDEIVELATVVRDVARHYGRPQDLEWARVAGRTFLVQSRPITTLPTDGAAAPGRPIVQGHAAAPGVVAGTVRRLEQPRGRRTPGAGRGARGADDHTRLGARDAAGRSPRDRARRRDLPRGDHQPRAAAPLRRRRDRGDGRAARRTAGDGRRRPRHDLRR